MTDATDPKGRDDLAAEFALGVLDGADLARADALARSDPAFQSAVARWRGRLAPLLDEIQPIDPPRDLWPALKARLFPGEGGGNVIQLRRRVTMWRTATGAATALAASLALILVTRPAPPPPQQIQQQATMPMIATLGDSTGAKLMASWSPGERMLVVAAAADMPVDAAHSHELWVIPAGGKPRSLGVMPARRHMMMHVPQPLSGEFRGGATLAVTLEPAGGSPSGDPTGPVLVSGQLEQA